MGKRNIRILCFIILFACLFFLTACFNNAAEIKNSSSFKVSDNTDKSKEHIKLKIFTQYTLDVDEKQPFDYAYSQMKKIMPEVDLDIDVQPQDDSSKLKIYAATGNLPDIIQVTAGIVDLFRKSNNLLVLDKYIKETKIEDRLLPLYKSLLWAPDKHSYAIPRTAPSTHLLFYNKDLFTSNNIKVPENFEEFLYTVKAFRLKGITPLAIFAKENWPGIMLFEDFVTRYEPEGLKKINEGRGSLKEEAYLKAANALMTCINAGLISKSAFLHDYDSAFTEFTSGNAPMFINGCWAIGPLYSKLGSKLDYLDFPFADTDTVKRSRFNRPGGGFDGGYSVSSNTKYKDITGKYTCLFSLELANGRVMKTAAPNPLTSDNIKPDMGYPPVSLKYAEQAKHFKTTTLFPWAFNSEVNVILGTNCAKLLTGKYPVKSFIEDTDNGIKLLLRNK